MVGPAIHRDDTRNVLIRERPTVSSRIIIGTSTGSQGSSGGVNLTGILVQQIAAAKLIRW
jgi:hypothetical protein